MNGAAKPRVGILLLGCPRFRHLGAETRQGDYEARKEDYAEQFLGQIGEIADPACPGIVYSREEVEEAIRFFVQRKVDCVLCTFLSWSQDFAWIRFLRDMIDIPLLLYLPAFAKAQYADTRDEDDFVSFLGNGGLVGSLVGSGSIPRCGRSTEVVVDDFPSAKQRIRSFLLAAQARARLRTARFGLLAAYNELMWSTYVDPYNLFARIGPELHFISYGALREEVDQVSDDAAQGYVQELSKLYTVEPDVDSRLFFESARASLALDRLRDRLALDALVINDVDHELFRAIGLRPGFYPAAFNQNNAVLVPEGDVGAAVIIYALKQMTGRHINFAEPFYIEKASNSFSAGHAGPNDYTDKDVLHLVRISRDIRFAKTDYKYAGAPFGWYRISPGLKTFAHFSENDGAYKVVCFTAESLPGAHRLCSYSHSDFKPAGPVTSLFEGIIQVGTTQHFAVVDGDVRAELSLFARINGFEFHDLESSQIH